ncbi:MAG: SusC/RagA family TonB-linked outer membrane protein [Janthinobacterium lividum]
MKKLLHVSVVFLLLFASQVFAQNRTITGTVTAKEDGLPLPGVSVQVQGTTVGTVTGIDGKFSIIAPSTNNALVFTFIGYNPQTVSIGSNTNLIVNLTISSRQLGEVVITGALGIRRQAKELGFAATNIESKDLTQARPTNFTNGLAGKVPGLVISTLDNGINPSTRFTLRGNRHINGNNYALVVLNGVPISPNDVNTINPDDIESVNVLNGAGAAALYGSEASNGALIITTKRGSANGTPQITYNNTFQLENISYFPKLQTRFGSYGGEGGDYVDPLTGFIIKAAPFENQSYGPEYTGALTQLGIPAADGTIQKYPYSTPSKDPRLAFFQTGKTEQNNLSYAAGDAANSFNLSVSNVKRTGVVPKDKYDRTTARVSATKTYGIFKADFTAGYTQENTSTYGAGFDGTAIDAGRSLLSTLLNTPSWVPLTNFKDINSPFADVNTYYNSYGVNPYWIINNSRYNTRADNFNGSFTGTVTPTKWLDGTYRIASNFGTAVQQFTRAQVDFSGYAHSDPTGGFGTEATSLLGNTANTPGSLPGQVQNITQFGDGSIPNPGLPTGVYGSAPAGPQGYSRIQQDVLLNFHHTFFNDFKANLLVGNTIWEESLQQITNSSTNLLVSNFYNIGSILGVPTTTQTTAKIRQIAYFSSLNIGYKDYAFLEGTLRNDRDSRLSAANKSFYYPSIKGSFIFTQAISELQNNKIISFGKLRASYSKVGDVNVSPYTINNTFGATSGFPYGNTGGQSLSTTLNNPNLKPEFTKELELGADLGFFDSRININATYYANHTTNQTIGITTSPATGYQNAYVNIGDVQNTGYELKLNVQALTRQKNKVGLDLGGNFSIQNSKIVSLTNGLNQVSLGGYSNASIFAVVGQPYPTLYATDVQRDPQGHVIVDATTGNPKSANGLVYMGRTTPKYILGLTQSVSYKFIVLSLTSEFRTGNVIYNQGLQQATAAGVSALSASSGRQRFVFPNSVINTGTAASPVYTPNTNITTSAGDIGFFDAGDYYNSQSSYVTSGAFWKLREANLNFDLTSFVKKSRFIKRASFALVGRNLLMLRPKSNTWTDPEFSGTSGNAVGYSNSQLPPTRILGANLNVTF